MADSNSTVFFTEKRTPAANVNARFRRLLIRDLLVEVRILTRINQSLAIRAERDLFDLAGG